MTNYIRGSMLFFDATFVDKNGDPATPSSATLYLAYTDLTGTRVKTTVTMTLAGNVASCQWDSAIAADCTVQWSIKGVGSNAIVQDGSLILTANETNPTS
jgi:hypothetical protein